MDDSLAREATAIATDHRSGASALLRRVLGILKRAAAEGPEALDRVSLLVCRAQPSMGSIWNAACVALGAHEPEPILDRFEAELDRAPAQVVQVALTALLSPAGPTRLVTCSASGTVSAVLEALGGRRPLRVACAEGRPVYEGRGLAARLADRGIAVELYTDAGLGGALPSSDAVLIGADAVAPTWVVNKSGSAQLAALAAALHVPVYVVATHDKLVPPAVVSLLRLAGGPAEEVWDAAPAAVTIRNPYLECVPLRLIRAVLTDRGSLKSEEVRRHCDAATQVAGLGRLKQLMTRNPD